jgi:spermidine synthase
MKVTTTLAFILIGFTATIGQIIVLRELLTVFSGSELAVAMVLAAWLFWTALGGLLGGTISRSYGLSQPLFGYLQSFSGVILTVTIFFSRVARSLFQIGAGELVTLGQMLAISFLTLAPFCLISGVLFSLACSLLAAQIPAWTRSPGVVYFLEGLGAGIGGLLFTLLLIHYFNAIQIASGIALLLCGLGLILTLQASRGRWLHLATFVVIFLCLFFVQHQSTNLDRISREWQWAGFRLIDSEETIFGHIIVVAKENQLSFFESGLWNFAVPDQLSAEGAVHYALLQHPEPKSVLLIGGGVSESLSQLLQHPSVRNVEYVELDPRLIQLGKIHLPVHVTAALKDPRVMVLHQDGRQYLAHSSNLYDAILVNLPEPYTAQINRFYTQEFFRLAASKMREGGVFSFTASGSETALGPIQAKYLKLLYLTALKVFPEVVVFPGQTARFFCSNSPGILTTQPETLVQRLQQRKLQLLYVQDHYILWDLSPLRQETFLAMVDQAGETGVNSDLNPRAYSYNLLMWSSQYSQMIGRVFSALSKRMVWTGMLILCGLVALLSFRQRFGAKSSSFPTGKVLYAVSIFGLTEISLEILIVFAFQLFFGYVYYKIGLLLAFFMIGLAAGSFTLSSYPRRRSSQIRALVTFQTILACFCLALAMVIVYFHNRPALNLHHFLYRETFSFMSFAAGFIGGTHFPLANRLLLTEQTRVGRVAGLIYAVDLLGSFLGCLLVGLVFIPSVGILQTLMILALVNISAILPFIISWPTTAVLER